MEVSRQTAVWELISTDLCMGKCMLRALQVLHVWLAHEFSVNFGVLPVTVVRFRTKRFQRNFV